MGYLDAQQGDGGRTAFRRAEKKYKLYKHASTTHKHSRTQLPPTDLSEVVDFAKISQFNDEYALKRGIERFTDAKYEFPVYVLDNHPGFYFIPQAVKLEKQFHYIREALNVYPEPPNRTSHTAQYGPLFGLWSASENKHKLVQDEPVDISSCIFSESTEISSPNTGKGADNLPRPRVLESGTGNDLFIRKWKFADKADNEANDVAVSAESLLRKLRWATLGVQFDWSKRAYDVSLPYRKFPKELSELATKLAAPAMNGGEFRAEAAIVNFFGPDDMLGGHIDDMEADWSKPIVSISLGCKAIFLLGGENREDIPVAMFLRSGDAVLMAGPARRCFHGVPRIFVDCEESDLPDFSSVTIDSADDDAVLKYIQQSRININIRQVF